MAKVFIVPEGCSLITDGKISLLIKNDLKESLLTQGILRPHTLIAQNSSLAVHLKGRGFLSSIPLQGSNGIKMIVKHCLRGGLIRFLTKDIFWQRNRPFNEMVTNREILQKGIKTTEIIAAAQHTLVGPFYKAYLFSKELPESIDVISYCNTLQHCSPEQRFREKKYLFQSLAKAIFKMHHAGIYHCDLHLKNILIQQRADELPEIYIIDFDKAVIKKKLSPRERIKNLLRFNRSIEKLRLKGGKITRTDQMIFFKEYFNYDSDTATLFEKNRKRYSALLRLRKVKWSFINLTTKMFTSSAKELLY